MNNKKGYTSPEIEIVALAKEDIITTSGGGLINGGSGSGDGGNWGDFGV